MTKLELIQLLSDYQDDAEIMINVRDYGYDSEINIAYFENELYHDDDRKYNKEIPVFLEQDDLDQVSVVKKAIVLL